MKIFFGTDGWRGLLDSEVNESTVAVVARAFADYMIEQNLNKCAIAYDGRRNSKKFAEIFSGVLFSSNIEVLISDMVIPTPVLSFTVKNRGFDCGVMITASHNPPEYNGIKFKDCYGGPFVTEKTHLVEKFLYKNEIGNIPPIDKFTNMLDDYFSKLDELLDTELISNYKQPIVVDSMFGAGGRVIEKYLGRLGLNTVTTICGDIKEDFGGRAAEPIEQNLAPLIDVLTSDDKIAIGFATDGDADRLGVISSGGEWLSAQETIILLADYVKNVRKIDGDVIKTSSVTGKLEKVLPDVEVHEVQVGFKYICEKMLETSAAFGAEESGGFGYGFAIPERDGILSALLFVEMLAYYNVNNLKELLTIKRQSYGNIFYRRVDKKYSGENRTLILPELYKNPPDFSPDFLLENISSYESSRGIINGLKFHFGSKERWLLIRASETEPIVRFYAEGKSSNEVELLLAMGLSLFGLNEEN